MSLSESQGVVKRKRLLAWCGALGFVVLVTLGVFASNGWLPSTDPMTGRKTGWFGRELPKNASSSWNPFAAPLPSPTPQLSKEYIYASGSRLLAVEDANANAAPPADLAIWRPSSGEWWIYSGSQQTTVAAWGVATDIPVPGDYDGDGKTDFCVFRPSEGMWYIVNSSTGSPNYVQFGQSGDKPVAADFDGDGKTDVAVFRPSTGTWFISRTSDSTIAQVQFGLSTDVPAPADFDGDGRADINVWRDSNYTFYTLFSGPGSWTSVVLGSTSGEPIPGDYDGDGKANYARLNGNSWLILNAAGTSTSTVTWQNSGDVPIQNDYDGDGIVDIAVWRASNGNWYIRQSSKLGQQDELRQVQWGMSGDIPVPAFYRR
jgi:hypothetical protein